MSASQKALFDQEIEAVHNNYAAKKFKEAGDLIGKIGKPTQVVGTAISLVGAIDPDPSSALILKAVGSGVSAGAPLLSHGIGTMLDNHAYNLLEEALRKSPPLSISVIIDKDMDQLNKERSKLYKKLTQAKERKWYRKISDTLLFTTEGKRLEKAEAKYRPLLEENEKKRDKLVELKSGIMNSLSYLDQKAANGYLSSTEEELRSHNVKQIQKEIQQTTLNHSYLLEQVRKRKNPNIYKGLVNSKEEQLEMLQKTLKSHRPF